MSGMEVLLFALIVVVLGSYLWRWMRFRSVQQYPATEVAKKLKENKNTVLLDVRTGQERSRRHIAGSVHIPLRELRLRASELERHKNKEVICYCQTGSRSLSAAATLQKMGYNASSMKGGIVEWR